MTSPEPTGGPPPRPARPPLSPRVKWVATAVLGLTAFAALFDRKRPTQGELLIQSGDARVRVAVRRGGEVVVPWTDRRSIPLPPGAYDVVLDADHPSYRAAPATVRVRPGGRAVVHVRALPDPPPQAGANPEGR